MVRLSNVVKTTAVVFHVPLLLESLFSESCSCLAVSLFSSMGLTRDADVVLDEDGAIHRLHRSVGMIVEMTVFVSVVPQASLFPVDVTADWNCLEEETVAEEVSTVSLSLSVEISVVDTVDIDPVTAENVE